MKVRKISNGDARLRRLAHDLRTALEQQPREHVTAVIMSSLGDVEQAPEVAPADNPEFTEAGKGAPFIHVEFHDHRPSHVLPILAVVTEYGRGISTITHNMKARRR